MARHRLDPYAGRRKIATVVVGLVLTLLGAGYATTSQPGHAIAGVGIAAHR